MALHVENIVRTFLLKKNNQDIPLDDPNPAFTPEEVLTFYSNIYAELTNSTIFGPKLENDKLVFEFKTTIGIKG